MVRTRDNERSWAIQIISELNLICNKNHLAIKSAGGEITIDKKSLKGQEITMDVDGYFNSNSSSMFPDVVLYGDKEMSHVLQGWEIKMPDVSINNPEFFADARRKARAIGARSFVQWNFTYVRLYITKDGETFDLKKQWDFNEIKTRNDVRKLQNTWKNALKEVLYTINKFILTGEIREKSLFDALSTNTITELIMENKSIVADFIKEVSKKDRKISAYLELWWNSVQDEYAVDETDQYGAYAKNILMNWANRFLFAHFIKYRQVAALMVDDIDDKTLPEEANKIFSKISQKADFYNIFIAPQYNELIPKSTWSQLIEFSLALKYTDIGHIPQVTLQNVLENTVDEGRRLLQGQYTTPVILSDILARITIIDATANVLDPCCGTGTIIQSALQVKINSNVKVEDAIDSVWASDKYQVPLQLANMSMANLEVINMPVNLFQHDALSLSVGDKVNIVNPNTGKLEVKIVPSFTNIVSNLPFIEFERIGLEEDGSLQKLLKISGLGKRSDLYMYIILALSRILVSHGRLGVIISNSWLSSKSGEQFIKALTKFYIIKQIHISGKGRWFNNASVVTTVLILEKKEDISEPQSTVSFCRWEKSIDEMKLRPEYINTIVRSSLLNKEINPTVMKVFNYDPADIERLREMNMSYNALFYGVRWLVELREKLVQIENIFDVFRGSRRGWDALFYSKNSTLPVDDEYIRPVLISSKDVKNLIVRPNGQAFCCSESIESLKKRGKYRTLDWIVKFKDILNGVGKPLPEVLARKNTLWYELPQSEIADFFTSMNPDKRLFFGAFNKRTFINQRLIGLRFKNALVDDSVKRLYHALLNSVLSMLFIECTGFGRGEGVLDLTKTNVSSMYMLNPSLLKEQEKIDILNAFEPLLHREIKTVEKELQSADRINFEKVVFHSFHIEDYYEKVVNTLIAQQNVRHSIVRK